MLPTVTRFVGLSALALLWILSPGARADETVNSIGMEFVLIPAGSFIMGAQDESGSADELPRHRVAISKPFYLGKYQVTQKEWQSVMGNNPSARAGRNLPVEMVSWADAQAFIAKLNQKERVRRYRLPTEAEWEYAARAGATTAFFFGDDFRGLDRYAWHADNSDERTHPVGGKDPNPWGLYDIFGNVWEWTNDWYGDDYYANSPSSDPPGAVRGKARVNRGCSFHFIFICSSSYRGFDENVDYVHNDIGFRLAFTAETEPALQIDYKNRRARNYQ
ncbi:MAG: formylglycine-generating enzyme family protein [Deltaproteobacteria bacterium]|nr:formylglycine-generating enzyme family protein [Deltaproteobacteria bacterium]